MTWRGDHVSQSTGTGLLGWLGFGSRDMAKLESKGRDNLLRQVRGRLLNQINAFLLDHDLEVTAANLVAAHSAFAGLDPGLDRRIRRRLERGETISQAWLDRAIAADEGVPDNALDQLAQQLEDGIDKFSRNARSARSATSDYGDALAEHVDSLESTHESSDVVASLADYARAMLERSRKAEEDLRMAEEEAALLRQNLARARRDAEVDFLTGLPNRRAFEGILEQEYARSRATLEPLSVAFCDIDLFKRINDTHGHDAGDRIICVVAEMLAEVSGDRCHVARHGGEEFVLLLPRLQPEDAFAILDAAREKMAARRLLNRHTEEPFGQITFSGGVADVFAYENPRAALAAADEALYEAKQSGRNRICLARPAS